MKASNNRRVFIRQVGLAAASVLVLPNLGCLVDDKKRIGIQLYSLRDEFPKGVENVIAEVSKAGYSWVEVYGYSAKDGFWGLTAPQFKQLLDKYSLTSPSGHYNFHDWEKTGDESIIDDYIKAAKVLKQTYIVVPGINPQIFNTTESVKAFAKKLNKVSEKLEKEGLKLAYHNHDFEFKQLGDKTAYQILVENTHPNIEFELDLYWAVRAKQDVLKLFKTYKGRFTLWHVKDMDKINPKKNTEVGSGSINFESFVKEAKLSGLKYPFVEQENFDINPFESIKISAKRLQNII
ncbi:sugar phosphate isomerase/epimerase family protein [Pedobacter puniceum]|uniref:TIM barrel protein n=1 Tax=Pedobacter puniceum TaxID=2666136 RepID=A0A7K0FS56_9SPHI|nr:sugar phosphate isomerase/epimerase [Pedobacter puniceum]MRX48592.1 TIM barrel protein [Pedobacter puniceum]